MKSDEETFDSRARGIMRRINMDNKTREMQERNQERSLERRETKEE